MYWFTSHLMDNLSAKNVANFPKVYEIRSSKIKYTQGSQ